MFYICHSSLQGMGCKEIETSCIQIHLFSEEKTSTFGRRRKKSPLYRCTLLWSGERKDKFTLSEDTAGGKKEWSKKKEQKTLQGQKLEGQTNKNKHHDFDLPFNHVIPASTVPEEECNHV